MCFFESFMHIYIYIYNYRYKYVCIIKNQEQWWWGDASLTEKAGYFGFSCRKRTNQSGCMGTVYIYIPYPISKCKTYKLQMYKACMLGPNPTHWQWRWWWSFIPTSRLLSWRSSSVQRDDRHETNDRVLLDPLKHKLVEGAFVCHLNLRRLGVR